MLKSLCLCAAVMSADVALASDIETPFSGDRPNVFELHAGFAWYGNGVAGGVRFGIPIVDNGFVPSINNSVYINFGIDGYFAERYYDGRWQQRGAAFGIPVALQWNFYFSDEWSAYLEAGFNFYLDRDGVSPGYQWGIGALGGRYHFSDSTALILRLGSPYSSLGLEIAF